jgi:acetyl-CoA acetyltransferase family protein
MAATAETLARQYGINRQAQDEYALRSQKLAAEAWNAGRFRDEVIPVGNLANDDHMRPSTTLEGLAKLPAAFSKDGFVTAGNASGIVDGGAAVVVTTRDRARSQPLGRIVSWGIAGVPPEIMGIGPVPATRIALEKAGLNLPDIDFVEVNEAFAAQYLAVEKALELDRNKVNVNGGAIALGHPLGATGTRLVMTLLYELKRRKKKYGLAAACIGGGQGIAMIVEALS